MASFGSLYVGVSGLNVSQAALNVTSHNLANIDTKGYVRQQPVITDFQYVKGIHLSSMQLGLVPILQKLNRSGYVLDQAYRQEIGRQAFMNLSIRHF